MAFDTPFVALPSPPVSATQPAKDALVRGYDHGAPDDEYAKAVAYRDSIALRVRNRIKFLNLLKGDSAAYLNLQRKTLPLAESSPPHYEGP